MRNLSFFTLCMGSLASSLWVGGLVVVGAVVAPAVFQNIPAPLSGDVMIVVLHRFHMFVLGCALFMLAMEGLRAKFCEVRRLDWVRLFLICGAAGMALIQTFLLSPGIESLYRAGVVRGSGEQGRELQTIHSIAEKIAHGQLLLLLAAFVIYLLSGATSFQSRNSANHLMDS
ncbi:DUF4149 domain-containing protein [Pajaroellobacter abortibovis]|uniref:TMEM205-like domain-containing protein n=1 Tax=Pajaroellobacter abortibovis TaxID=1882918 RepID=A0A1L6MVN1_9BACT|nr:DUF4149 domain-containing protein [Pajaroellobacter abortibovis]APR99576.1 hypothetical protein BCY86_01930 [Pajaroellobacter abortibovis]